MSLSKRPETLKLPKGKVESALKNMGIGRDIPISIYQDSGRSQE